MKKLPVLQDGGADKQELRRRLSLANRPRLKVGLNRLDQVASVLATNNRARASFVQNPTAYLQAQSLPVSSCTLVKGVPAQTSEVCTTIEVCNVGTFVDLVAIVNVLSTALFITKVKVLTSAVEYEAMARPGDMNRWKATAFSEGVL